MNMSKLNAYSMLHCLLALTISFFAYTVAHGQPTQTPAATASPAQTASQPGESKASAVGAGTGGNEQPQDLKFVSDFKLLKMLSIAATLMGVAAGLAVYAIRHRRVQKFDILLGLTVSIILSPLLLFCFTKILSIDASACLGLNLSGESLDSVFADSCRSARETTANVFGFVWLWTMIFGKTIINGTVSPIEAGAVKMLMYVSITITSLLLFSALKPLAKFVLYKK